MHLSSLISTSLITLSLALGTALAGFAQTTYRLPGQHAAEHSGLTASQDVSALKVSNTEKFLDEFYPDEDAPEGDIYTQGWNSGRVNCYQGVTVPNRQRIDVSHFAIPVPGAVTSPYGYRARFGRMHKGVDLRLRTGDPVKAAFSGRVRIVNYEGKGYGNYVVIRHDNGLETVYGHLSKHMCKAGQAVRAGDVIGLGGSTGHSTGPHLHFETRYMGYAINPQAIFDFANQTTITDDYTFDKRTYTQARSNTRGAFAAKKQTVADEADDADNFRMPTGNTANAEAAVPRPAKPKAKPVAQAKPRPAKPATKDDTVRKGDSLSRIADRNGITIDKLRKMNGLKDHDVIQPGQKLRVK